MSQSMTVFQELPALIYIPGGLEIGSQVIVRGRVPEDEERFHINLQYSDEFDSTVAFHFNPRNSEDAVVRNTFEDDLWDVEETVTPFFDFTYGSKFTIRILVQESAYFVTVNGKQFPEFEHRLSYQNVEYVLLSEGAEYYEAYVQNPCHEPCNGKFPTDLKEGDCVRVRGVVKDQASGFEINLCCDQKGHSAAMHFNPRQSMTDVVMNTRINGEYELEEMGKWCKHFEAGQFFDVVFVIHKNQFVISVNNEYFASYELRLPQSNISYYSICGDVILMNVDFAKSVDLNLVKEIPSGLEIGDVISVKGYFYGERFHVNLLNGTSVNDNVALCANQKRGGGQIVLNTRVDGFWQTEEKLELPNGLKENIPFHQEFIYYGDKFDVYLNGHKLGSLKDRNGEMITGVQAVGSAYIHKIELLQKQNSPVVDKVPKSLETGSWMSVIFMPTNDSITFAINLQDGESQDTEDDIALHFNPRFYGTLTVCNSFIERGWGHEEKKFDDFPFQPLERSEVNILTMDDNFRVFVNGNHYVNYAHRFDRSRVNHLRLNADCHFHEPNYYF